MSLSKYVQEAQTALFNEMGVFFAFSDQQFNAAKKDGVEYVSLGLGMICPKDNASKVNAGLSSIHKKGIQQDLAENGKTKIIRRELFNFECFYTGSIDDCVETLEFYGISRQEILKVYNHILETEDVDM